MRTIRQRLVLAPLLAAASLTACSSGGGAATTGAGAATSAPLATTTSSAAAPAATAATGGTGGSSLCSAFTATEVGAFIGGSATSADTSAPGFQRCVWTAGDVTVTLQSTTETEICDSDHASAMAAGGGLFDGDWFAGKAIDRMVAGIVKGDTCDEVRVAPFAKSPKVGDVLAFAKLLVQKAGG